jgi:hypothetical protein
MTRHVTLEHQAQTHEYGFGFVDQQMENYDVCKVKIE